jgi:hypothetical protein
MPVKKIALTMAAVASLGLAACNAADTDADANNTAEATDLGDTTNEAVTDVNAAATDAMNAADAALDNAGQAVENAGEAVENAAEAVETNGQ